MIKSTFVPKTAVMACFVKVLFWEEGNDFGIKLVR